MECISTGLCRQNPHLFLKTKSISHSPLEKIPFIERIKTQGLPNVVRVWASLLGGPFLQCGKCQRIGTRPDPAQRGPEPALSGRGQHPTQGNAGARTWQSQPGAPPRTRPAGCDHTGLHTLHFLSLRTQGHWVHSPLPPVSGLTPLWDGVCPFSPAAPVGPSTTKNQPRAGSTFSARSALTLSGSHRLGLDLPLTPWLACLGPSCVL